MSFREDAADFLFMLEVSKNNLIDYIYSIRENTEINTETNSMVADWILTENKEFGSFDNTHLIKDLNYLYGILDVYESHIAQLGEMFKENND